MANPISNQAHIDPKVLRQHNNKHLQSDNGIGFGVDKNNLNKPFTISDPVSISQKTESAATYSSSLTLDRGVAGDGFDLLRGLVLNMLKEQGIDTKIATGQKDAGIDISQLSQEEAQALIADDGYFGVEKTSDRIVDFAIAMAGGDPSRLAAIKEGVTKGFNEALNAFGGWLPEISYNTFDAVMNKLDSWAEKAGADQPA
jgi:hypothetical protein